MLHECFTHTQNHIRSDLRFVAAPGVHDRPAARPTWYLRTCQHGALIIIIIIIITTTTTNTVPSTEWASPPTSLKWQPSTYFRQSLPNIRQPLRWDPNLSWRREHTRKCDTTGQQCDQGHT
jgi:hypothetical protein